MISIVGLVVLSNGLLAAVEYRRAQALLQTEFHRKVRSIASTAAAVLDPELVAATRAASDQDKPEYRTLKIQLQNIRNLNRREDVWIADIYTLIPAPQSSEYVEYGVDAEDRFPYEHHIGDVYMRNGQPVTIGIDGINRLAANLGDFQAGFNAAFAPIRDNSGKLIAVLGVSLSPAPYSTLNEIGSAMIVPWVVTVILAVIFAAILGRSVTRPLESLHSQIERIGAGDLNVETPSGMSGEFKAMAAAIAAMAKGCANATLSSAPFQATFPGRFWNPLWKRARFRLLKVSVAGSLSCLLIFEVLLLWQRA
jgi:HAMP domain-containing protein